MAPRLVVCAWSLVMIACAGAPQASRSATSLPSNSADATEPQVAAAVEEPFDDYAGRWAGTWRQDQGSHGILTIELVGDADVGASLGQVDYDTGTCVASLIRLEAGDDLVALEKMINGPTCIDGGKFQFDVDGDQLTFRWFYPSGQEGAWGELTRAM